MTARLFLFLFVFFALPLLCVSGCSSRQAPPPQSLQDRELSSAEDVGTQIWQRFRTRAAAAEIMSGPFRISGTLRYTDTKGTTIRVSSLLWGNGQVDSPYPLRLDLLAGVGTVVAKAREDKDAFTVYVPEEQTVYTQGGKEKTLASFGVPVPLSLGDLTLLLTGRCGVLFLPTNQPNDSGTPEHVVLPGGARFTISHAKLSGILELSSTGAPLSWKEKGPEGWNIGMEPGEINPLQPRRLRISHPKGHSALVVVKEISRVSPPYSTEQMSLDFPSKTTHKLLAQ